MISLLISRIRSLLCFPVVFRSCMRARILSSFSFISVASGATVPAGAAACLLMLPSSAACCCRCCWRICCNLPFFSLRLFLLARCLCAAIFLVVFAFFLFFRCCGAFRCCCLAFFEDFLPCCRRFRCFCCFPSFSFICFHLLHRCCCIHIFRLAH